LEFNCICCGTCCRKFQPRLNTSELEVIAGRLGITVARFIADYTDHRWPGTLSYLLVHRDEACVFLYSTPDTHLQLCRIHDFKPSCCRDWAAGIQKSECRAGLKNLCGIEVDALDQMHATSGQQQQLAARWQSISQL
jgi:Fe-S-cluster containining protein